MKRTAKAKDVKILVCLCVRVCVCVVSVFFFVVKRYLSAIDVCLWQNCVNVTTRHPCLWLHVKCARKPASKCLVGWLKFCCLHALLVTRVAAISIRCTCWTSCLRPHFEVLQTFHMSESITLHFCTWGMHALTRSTPSKFCWNVYLTTDSFSLHMIVTLLTTGYARQSHSVWVTIWENFARQRMHLWGTSVL